MPSPATLRRGLLAVLLLAVAVLPSHGEETDPIPELIRVASRAEDFKLRLSAVLGLARTKDPRAVEPLLKAIKDKHHTVRGAAAGALSGLEDPRIREALEAAVQTDPDDYVRAQAQKALVALMAAEEGKAHGGDGTNMEVLGSLGTLDHLDITRGMATPTSKALKCLEQRLDEEPYLGGSLHYKFRVARDGKVRWVKLLGCNLGNLEVERCIMAAMATATFRAPRGGEAEFDLPLDLGGGDEITTLERQTSTAAAKLATACEDLLATDDAAAPLKPPARLRLTLYLDDTGAVKSAGMVAAGEEIPVAFADRLVANLKGLTLKDKTLAEGAVGKLIWPWKCEPKKVNLGKGRRKRKVKRGSKRKGKGKGKGA